MAAVSQAIGQPGFGPVVSRPRLRVVTDATRHAPPERVASIRSIEATRRSHRLASAAVTVAALCGLWFATGALAPSAHQAPSPGAIHAHHGLVYVVRPGDTLWSIATNVVGSKDSGAVVASLRAELHGAVLRPGTVLRLP